MIKDGGNMQVFHKKNRHKQLDVFSRFSAIIQMRHYFETIFSTALSIIYTCNKLKLKASLTNN